MNIQTHRNILHRHFVAAPLLLTLLLVSIMASSEMSMFSASSFEAPLEPWRFREDSGIAIYANASARIEPNSDHLILLEGSMTAASEGLLRLEVGNATVLGLAGGIFVVRNGPTLTIAALTSPALLRVQDRRHVLVPAGMQWRGNPDEIAELSQGFDAWTASRQITPVPEDFFRDQLTLLRKRTPLKQSGVLPPRIDHIPLPPVSALLRFAAAADRAKESWERDVLGYLRFLLEEGDTAGALRVLSENPGDVFASGSFTETYGPALLSIAHDTSIAMELLSRLIAAPGDSLGTLASAHPRFASLFWTLGPIEALQNETAVIRLLGLPASDDQSESIPEIAVQKWQAAVEAYLAALEGDSGFLVTLTEVLLNTVRTAERMDHPARARVYTKAVLALTASARATLSEKLQQDLRHLERGETLVPVESSLAVAVPTTMSDSVEVQEMSALDKDALESRARSLLTEAGALFGVSTVIEAENGTHVRVENIVFASREGDRSFAFTLDPFAGVVSSIRTSDTSYPFSMALDVFVGWVRVE